ncbi:MAG: DUF350 domain-containing protein [Vicinamibacterales bacterium]
MMSSTLATNVLAALLFALVGIGSLVLSFVVLDRLTPYALWQEIVEKQNLALAVFVGALSLGLSIIIAAAIH